MLQALKEAGKCEPVQTAFCVGCVLVVRLPDQAPVILSTGYSRELPGNTHAEANALTKACFLSAADIATLFPSLSPTPTIDVLLALANVYTTLEPCSVRTSGLPPCTDALIQAKVKRCIIGVGEPDDFVKCEGARKLQEAGIEIVWLHDMQTECLAAARRAHIPTPR
ncbi:cytidine deaminase-like protein [Pisolithus croceorrhizus]|nr:cytidine deaminase-like protein [Pisolithus croceorrhizus]KAI6132187.1 cytidine deaminase-like protein [Pisolithus croceorrhizus]